MQAFAQQHFSDLNAVSNDRIDFTYASVPSVNLRELTTGQRLLAVQVIIDTPFDGTTPTATVGYPSAVSAFMKVSENSLTSVSKYETNPDHVVPSGTEMVTLYLTLSGATAGAGSVLIFYT